MRMIRRYFDAKRLRPFKTCALMLDLRGREIRVGRIPHSAEAEAEGKPQGLFFDVA